MTEWALSFVSEVLSDEFLSDVFAVGENFIFEFYMESQVSAKAITNVDSDTLAPCV